MSFPLAVSYAAMYAVQSRGADIIGALWGPAAKEAALAQNVDDVQPDADVGVLCGGYASAHFDQMSNILHAAAMLTAVYAAVNVFLGPVVRRSSVATVVQWFLWIWPVYYLPAWVGHLWFQKDIPAVFSYGTTFRGWAAGEYCAFVDLFSGGIVQDGATELLPTAVFTFVFILGIEAAMPKTTRAIKKTKMS